VAEDAVRSETVSRPVLAAICDLQGDFQKLQGELIRCLSNFVMVSRCCKGFSLLREQGAFFGICREEQRGIANGGRVWRRFHFALAGLTIASVRKRTWKIANRRGESGWVPDQEGCRLFPHQDRRGTYRGAGSGGYRANHVGDSR